MVDGRGLLLDSDVGGLLLVETLNRFKVVNPGNLSMLLAGIMMMWLVWPVVCGFLAARRGHAMSGVIHGFMWGPLGLVPVLLSSPKRRCPTCGKKTLTDAHAAGNASAALSPPGTVAAPGPPGLVPPVISDPAAAVSVADSRRMGDRRRCEESDPLLAWVNGETAVQRSPVRQWDAPSACGVEAELSPGVVAARVAAKSSV